MGRFNGAKLRQEARPNEGKEKEQLVFLSFFHPPPQLLHRKTAMEAPESAPTPGREQPPTKPDNTWWTLSIDRFRVATSPLRHPFYLPQ